MKSEPPEQKNEAPGWPRLKNFLIDNCSSTHFVPKSLWKFFWTIIMEVMSI